MDILVVDDDAIDRLNIKRTLNQSGLDCDILETTTAIEALKITENMVFDLILLDYQLPVMTGLDFLLEFKNKPENTSAVVMLSHSNDDDLAMRCIEAGAQDFISKSEITMSRLKRAIQHAKARATIESELRKSKEQLRYLSEVDALTGLTNRRVLDINLNNALALAERQAKQVAIIILDLDKFKHINDTLGHAAGDQLLIEMAERLRRTVRESDILCRMGGDEFAVLMQSIDDVEVAQHLSQRILDQIVQPINLDGVETVVSTSIGIATFPEPAKNSFELFKYADNAMYEAKSRGRNQVRFFSKTMHDHVQEKIAFEHDLNHAIANDDLVLMFQPQFDHKSQHVMGATIMPFWPHPNKELVTFDCFLPVAKRIGGLEKITTWLIETACILLERWREDDRHVGITIEVPVSLSLLVNPSFYTLIKSLLNSYRIPVSCFHIQITQSELSRCDKLCAQLADQITEIPLILVLDQWDTYHVTLLHTNQLPIKAIKIDKTLLQPQIDDDSIWPLVRAIHAFFNHLDLPCYIANFTSSEQRETLSQVNFIQYQGNEFGSYLSAKDFEQLIKKGGVK